MDLYLPLFDKVANDHKDKSSKYQFHNRIIIRFFPNEKIDIGNERRLTHQFYCKRYLCYSEEKSGQKSFEFRS